MRFEYPEGATPLDPNESEGLLLSLSTQAELNEFELLNITQAVAWAASLSIFGVAGWELPATNITGWGNCRYNSVGGTNCGYLPAPARYYLSCYLCH